MPVGGQPSRGGERVGDDPAHARGGGEREAGEGDVQAGGMKALGQEAEGLLRVARPEAAVKEDDGVRGLGRCARQQVETLRRLGTIGEIDPLAGLRRARRVALLPAFPPLGNVGEMRGVVVGVVDGGHVREGSSRTVRFTA